MAKRCLIVSYYFPPGGGGGVQRIVKWIKYLSRAGWRFTVITADEKSNLIPADASLITEIPAQTKIISVENINPAQALKSLARKPESGKSSYAKRWLSAFFYIPDIRKNWLPRLTPVLMKELNSQNYDCVLFTIPPYSLAFLAAEMVNALDIPVILDLRDPWSMNPYKIHPSPFHEQKDRRLELAAIQKLPYLISAYQNIISFYRQEVPDFSRKKGVVIPNGYDEEDFAHIKSQKQDGEFFNMAFSGTLYSHLNNPAPLFKAMALLKKQAPLEGNRIRFHHLGKSMINLTKMAKRFGLSGQVHEWGYLPHREALQKLSGMDAFYFILDDRNKKAANTIGGKVYEYLRLKKPILALVPEEGEAAQLIRHTDSGVVLSPAASAEIAGVLKSWQEQRPQFGFNNIEEFSRRHQAERLGRFLEDVIKAR